MSVDLKNIPNKCWRPPSPRYTRWVWVLLFFVFLGTVAAILIGGDDFSLQFWMFAAAIPLALWVLLFFLYLFFFTLQNIYANAWDKQRENFILHEYGRGRRALKILFAGCRTAHCTDSQFSDIQHALMGNRKVLTPQFTWNGREAVIHSRLPETGSITIEEQLKISFKKLLKETIPSFNKLPQTTSVFILFNISSPVPHHDILTIWHEIWSQMNIERHADITEGDGLESIDKWLDFHSRDDAVLFVIAAQLSPVEAAMTAESIVGLLFANRCTQYPVPPLALLHRPEKTDVSALSLQSALTQATDWGPLADAPLQQLWIAGLDPSSKGHNMMTKALNTPLFSAISPVENLHDFHSYLGDPGCAAPWLAIATAALTASKEPSWHMTVSQQSPEKDIWSAMVAPEFTQDKAAIAAQEISNS